MGSDCIISVENLGKRYSLSHLRDQRYIALRDVLVDKATGLFRRKGKAGAGRPELDRQKKEDFWALKSVSFEVMRGDVIGVIGRNGAGKSTLLKILSRITDPTEGRVRLRGRVASLLEVGTGFHPELTGRENIFLNGAILGMSRAEIRAKFDEIVAFAETEKFLDTPVKRYSSGMYVRLAFAVAAHLEPEILVVDEVLAVGDAEFQKKCLGKMRHVATSEGRTVLFVSHNMAAIERLCPRCLLLDKGGLVADSASSLAIRRYLQDTSIAVGFERPRVRGKTQIESGRMTPTKADSVQFAIRLATEESVRVALDVRLKDCNAQPVGIGSFGAMRVSEMLLVTPPATVVEFALPTSQLANGVYYISLDITLPGVMYFDRLEDCLSFEVTRSPRDGAIRVLAQDWSYGCLELELRLLSTTPETAGSPAAKPLCT